MNTTSKQPMLTNMIDRHIRQEAEPVARADADALEAVILAELAKFSMDAFHINLTGFIDEVRTFRLNALVWARTAEVAKHLAGMTPATVSKVDL